MANITIRRVFSTMEIRNESFRHSATDRWIAIVADSSMGAGASNRWKQFSFAIVATGFPKTDVKAPEKNDEHLQLASSINT